MPILFYRLPVFFSSELNFSIITYLFRAGLTTNFTSRLCRVVLLVAFSFGLSMIVFGVTTYTVTASAYRHIALKTFHTNMNGWMDGWMDG